MAEVLKGGNPDLRIPWDKWLDGQTWLLRRGQDYLMESSRMAHEAQRACIRLFGIGYAVRVDYVEEGLIICRITQAEFHGL